MATAASERTALVLYGSETGNAHDVAEELSRLAQRLHFTVQMAALDAVAAETLAEHALVLIAISTTGQGDLPRNAQRFWKRLLRRSLPRTLLASARFALFGLGDTSYPQYNYAGLKLQKRLLQLGAEAVTPMGEADEQHAEGNEATLGPWLQQLQSRMLELWPLMPSQEVIPESALLQPQWVLALETRAPEPERAPATCTPVHVDSATIRLRVVVHSNERITPADHWQDVRHMVFSSPAGVEYAPGDVLEIQPRNPAEDVQQFVETMRWEAVADTRMAFTRNAGYEAAPSGSVPMLHPHKQESALSLRQILTESIDLNAIPKRSFFRAIAHFTQDEFQKQRLLEFADPEYTDELFDYTTRPRRSIVEVLQEFDSVRIPWEWLFAIFPPMRGRQFSIASGGLLKKDEQGGARFELLVAIVKYRTVIRKVRRGVCTRYLEHLDVGESLDVSLQRGSLAIDSTQAHVPLVLIGPGTGIAPLRALLWEKRLWQRSQTEAPASAPGPSRSGPNALFFGCRNRASDFFFHGEWDDLGQDVPLQVFVAFSRDQDRKVYVQDLLREHQSLILDLLHRRQGCLCICGSSGQMPRAVRAALTDIFEAGLACSRAEAEAQLRGMEKAGRYKQETW